LHATNLLQGPFFLECAFALVLRLARCSRYGSCERLSWAARCLRRARRCLTRKTRPRRPNPACCRLAPLTCSSSAAGTHSARLFPSWWYSF